MKPFLSLIVLFMAMLGIFDHFWVVSRPLSTISVFNHFWATLDNVEVPLWPFWAFSTIFGTVSNIFGPILTMLRFHFDHFGPFWTMFRFHFDHFGTFRKMFRFHFDRFWPFLTMFRFHFDHLGPFSTNFGAFSTIFGHFLALGNKCEWVTTASHLFVTPEPLN